jgi:MerR family mercuric resistance operon transcriptional regulator
MSATTFAIGELSRRTGSNIETIRYYERIGLLPAPPRRGRYRSYGPADVLRLGFLRRARELGFTLGDIQALFGLAAGGQGSCEAARILAEAQLGAVRDRIADLRRMERVLETAVRDCAAGKAEGCPLLDTLAAPSA